MKKDSAIIVIDLLDDAKAKKAAAFIDGNISGEGDKDVEILDTLPVLFLSDGKVSPELAQYANEDLTFGKASAALDAVNEAGQSIGEVLELLDIRSVYVLSAGPDNCEKALCDSLRKAGFEAICE